MPRLRDIARHAIDRALEKSRCIPLGIRDVRGILRMRTAPINLPPSQPPTYDEVLKADQYAAGASHAEQCKKAYEVRVSAIKRDMQRGLEESKRKALESDAERAEQQLQRWEEGTWDWWNVE